MKYLLAHANLPELRSLATGRSLLAFDFDGTLAPIVTRRDAARMRRSTAQLLTRVCAVFPCAVVSGRARTDVVRLLGEVPVRHVVGEHGADDGRSDVAAQDAIAAVLDALRQGLPRDDDIVIEVKRASLAVHYRRARRPERACAAIHEVLSSMSGQIRLVGGKCVVNVVSIEAPNKGDAIRRLLHLERAERSLYVGDDETDEDVFRLPPPVRPLTVRVGRSSDSRAKYYLRSQREIDLLLQVLVATSSRRDHPAMRVRQYLGIPRTPGEG
jgi:trehalose 6-phosphate phosphatase